ncbi:MAG: hypothetical protein IT356_01845 [Gemmatimonadaceae bacterium]|nr:hypothetical protein [Gemmatimonadaceae bacterium]
MAQHEVNFTIPERPLGKADVEFSIKRNGEAHGRLKVSNGTIVWVPKNKKYGYRLGWVRFDELMREHGDAEK